MEITISKKLFDRIMKMLVTLSWVLKRELGDKYASTIKALDDLILDCTSEEKELEQSS